MSGCWRGAASCLHRYTIDAYQCCSYQVEEAASQQICNKDIAMAAETIALVFTAISPVGFPIEIYDLPADEPSPSSLPHNISESLFPLLEICDVKNLLLHARVAGMGCLPTRAEGGKILITKCNDSMYSICNACPAYVTASFEYHRRSRFAGLIRS